MDILLGFIVGVFVGVFLTSCIVASRKGDAQGRLLTRQLVDRCRNIVGGARELDARIYAAPYGNKEDAVDVTDIVIPALEIIADVEVE